MKEAVLVHEYSTLNIEFYVRQASRNSSHDCNSFSVRPSDRVHDFSMTRRVLEDDTVVISSKELRELQMGTQGQHGYGHDLWARMYTKKTNEASELSLELLRMRNCASQASEFSSDVTECALQARTADTTRTLLVPRR
jgi:hypothetical protein